jgi:type VI protein secretion system component Hcp
MRPTANFALHALAAAALTAFAATSAAAAGANLFLKFNDSTRSDIAKGGGQIEIESYSWGAARTAAQGKVEHEWKVEEGESAPPPPGGVSVAAGDVDGDSRAAKKPRTTVKTLAPGATKPTTGQATGDPDQPVLTGNVPNASAAKRQHRPVTITKEWDASTPQLAKPLEKGSVWVRVATPWTACRVGARYPSLELGDGTKRHVLQDVTVASCGGSSAQEEVAFYYNRIAFNYAPQ